MSNSRITKSSEICLYIISYNRLTVLKSALNSYLRFLSPMDIVILDMGSDYLPLLEYFKDLKKVGISTINFDKITKPGDLNIISDQIDRENCKRGCDYYIVTDPDISIEICSNDILNIYKEILNTHEDIEIVGPMLRINDIPKSYPLREWAWKLHAEQFWHKKPESIQVGDRVVYVQRTVIDTTFGMIRSTTSYKRFLRGFRTYEPYEALHLDWYITPENITDDQLNFQTTTSQLISHWQGPDINSPPGVNLSKNERQIYIVKNNRIKTYYLPGLNESFFQYCIRSLKNKLFNSPGQDA